MTASAPRKSKKEFDPNKGYEELANSLIQIMEKGQNFYCAFLDEVN